MLLCLSSGARPRYREDIIRAISMPFGALLQFRYKKDLVEPHVFDNPKQWRACIAYLDRSDNSNTPNIIPCRLATLRHVESCGDFYVLQLELDEFWDTSKTKAFNDLVLGSGISFPHWKDATLAGYFVGKLQKVPDELIYQKNDEKDGAADWQALARGLSDLTDFRDECFFYHVRGVYKVESKQQVVPTNGIFFLKSDESYEARIFHYSPQSDDASIVVEDISWLLADTINDVVSITSNPHIGIDSPYDEKRLRFRTSAATTKQDGIISLYRVAKGGGAPEVGKGTWDLDLQMKVVPKLGSIFVRGTVIGVLLGIQAVVPIWPNSQITDKLGVTVAVMVLGLITGWAAAWGLKKP
jgi:hypothetical protein